MLQCVAVAEHSGRTVAVAVGGDQCLGFRYAIHDYANPQFCDSLVVIPMQAREIKYSDNLSDPLRKRNMATPCISRRSALLTGCCIPHRGRRSSRGSPDCANGLRSDTQKALASISNTSPTCTRTPSANESVAVPKKWT